MVHELGDTLHVVTGIAEILGGLGLALPSITRIRPELATPCDGDSFPIEPLAI